MILIHTTKQHWSACCDASVLLVVLRKLSFHFLERIKAEGERILKENDPRSTSRINPHSIFWMVAALAVFYYSDFYIALRFDSRIHR